MLGTFRTITPYFKFKPKEVSIDNLVFQFHYRWTFLILLVSTLLVTSRQYIGEHIKCISGGFAPDYVINTFCFFTTTFTLVRHLNDSSLAAGAIPHPGVGPLDFEEDPIKRHAYYQWVPYVLFGQAMLFYLPHFLWKSWEGGRIKILVNGLKMIGISKFMEKENLNIAGRVIPCRNVTEARITSMKNTFRNRLIVNTWWGRKLIICEVINLINVLVQIYFTNKFLAGQFYSLGLNVMKEEWKTEMDTLDIVFPKVTKCHFHKFGPSGSIQLHDALCVMALNVINEKIYTFLWFWFAFLLIASILALLWRLCTVLFYKSSRFTAFVYGVACPGRRNRHDLEVVNQHCNFAEWMFLYFLGTNMDGDIFRDFLQQTAAEYPEKKPKEFEEVDENAINERSEDCVEHKDNLLNHLSIDTVDSGRYHKEN